MEQMKSLIYEMLVETLKEEAAHIIIAAAEIKKSPSVSASRSFVDVLCVWHFEQV